MRFFLSSTALLTRLLPHEAAPLVASDDSVALIAYRGYLDLWSENATTGMPVDGEHAIVAYCSIAKLLAGLRGLEEQTITLDLHEFTPSTVYASRRMSPQGDWMETHFTI